MAEIHFLRCIEVSEVGGFVLDYAEFMLNYVPKLQATHCSYPPPRCLASCIVSRRLRAPGADVHPKTVVAAQCERYVSVATCCSFVNIVW